MNKPAFRETAIAATTMPNQSALKPQAMKLESGGKPSTWLPSGILVAKMKQVQFKHVL